ncbi:hypothetical protein ABPG75_001137 [Micractinium tetrahymenae]
MDAVAPLGGAHPALWRRGHGRTARVGTAAVAALISLLLAAAQLCCLHGLPQAAALGMQAAALSAGNSCSGGARKAELAARMLVPLVAFAAGGVSAAGLRFPASSHRCTDSKNELHRV